MGDFKAKSMAELQERGVLNIGTKPVLERDKTGEVGNTYIIHILQFMIAGDYTLFKISNPF